MKYLLLVFGIICAIFYILCVNTISPGNVGVVVNKLGDDKGIDQNYLSVGMHVTSPWKSVYSFPTFEQNKTWEGTSKEFNFQTSEGMEISASIGITYKIQPNMVPMIFQKYRLGIDEITDTFIRNYIRDALNKSSCHYSIEDLYGARKENFFIDVENNVKKDLIPIGIEISRIYLIGRFHFPDNIIKSLNSKIEANQRAQQRENELREAQAEAQKKVAQAEGEARSLILKSDAEAKSNLILSKSITDQLIQWQAAQKWDGKLPTVTSGSIPLINIGKDNKND